MTRSTDAPAAAVWLAEAQAPGAFTRAQLGQRAPWRPLGQPWRDHGPEPGFQPGWARIVWEPEALIYEVSLLGRNQHNRACAPNERTWETGDVCEIFLGAVGAPHYIELHVTPENHRLQLLFPLGAIEDVRAGRAGLSAFMIARPDWVETSTTLDAGRFTMRARLPATILGVGPTLDARATLRTAVCRYDYSAATPAPILSSTAALRAPWFHQLEDWTPLHLAPAGAPAA